MDIAVVGTGYVGTVTAACFAALGHDVIGLDTDIRRIGELGAGQLPFHEPGLSDLLLDGVASGRLRFASEPEAVLGREAVFLCLGTPIGDGGRPDLSQIEEALGSLSPFLSQGCAVVSKSTVPVGSGNWVRTLIEEHRRRAVPLSFAVVSNPEFLREGSAVGDFLHPDRIVLGGNNGALERVAELYGPLLRQDFPGGMPYRRPQLFLTDLASAEMIKYAANAFLATKISFSNEIAQLCELVGADVRQVLPAIGADQRIGAQFLNAGLGWGGSCFGKDVGALIATGDDYGYPSSLLRSTVDVNRRQRAAIIHKLQAELKALKGRRITLLGLSFKPDTDDLRDSPALELASRLLAQGCLVVGHDPVVKDVPESVGSMRTSADPYDAARRADALILATDWPEFADLDPVALRSVMTGSVVIDGRNMLDAELFGAAGLRVVGVGW